jgi:DinB superfamily
MIYKFNRYRKVRQLLLDTVSNLNTEQLNHIPAGFNNNIIWNIGHVIAAQQGICYRRAGKPLQIENDFFEKFKPGTKPETFLDSHDIDLIKSLALSTIDDFENDYIQKQFEEYETWTTRFGAEITSIDVAAEFIFFHEGLHTGYVMAMKKVLLAK